jgi:hypothetical protein
VAFRFLCCRVRCATLIMAQVTNVAFDTPSARPFLYDNHNQSLDPTHHRSAHRELYQVACHMLRRKSLSQPHPNDLQIDSRCTTPRAIWANWELTDRRQYTQAISRRNARLAHAAAIEGNGELFLGHNNTYHDLLYVSSLDFCSLRLQLVVATETPHPARSSSHSAPWHRTL